MLTHASPTQYHVSSLLSTVCHCVSADVLSLALGKSALKTEGNPLVEFSRGAKAICNIRVTLHKEAWTCQSSMARRTWRKDHVSLSPLPAVALMISRLKVLTPWILLIGQFYLISRQRCIWNNSSEPATCPFLVSVWRQTDGRTLNHWDLLRPRSGMVGSIGQHAVRLFHTLILVLVQVTVHLLPLFSGGLMTKKSNKCHSPKN